MILQALLADSLLATGKFLLTVIPLFVLGVVLAQLFLELRWFDKISWLARPLMRFGHLHPECAGTFVVAIVSPTAGHSMLAKYFNEKRISRSEVIIAAIVNALPGYIAQGRSVLPVTVPLIGALGFVFYGLVLFADLVKSMILLAIGGFILPKRDLRNMTPRAPSDTQAIDFKKALWNSILSTRKIVPKMLITMIPVTAGVFFLISLGIFEYAAKHLGIIAHFFPIRVESLPIVVTRLASPIGAYTMAGSLLSKGILGGKDIIMALLAGTLLSTVPNVRYLVPYYFGIFGPTLGTQLVIVSTLLRVLVFAAVIGLVAFFS